MKRNFVKLKGFYQGCVTLQEPALVINCPIVKIENLIFCIYCMYPSLQKRNTTYIGTNIKSFLSGVFSKHLQ
jgi:hypothetical protein